MYLFLLCTYLLGLFNLRIYLFIYYVQLQHLLLVNSVQKHLVAIGYFYYSITEEVFLHFVVVIVEHEISLADWTLKQSRRSLLDILSQAPQTERVIAWKRDRFHQMVDANGTF